MLLVVQGLVGNLRQTHPTTFAPFVLYRVENSKYYNERAYCGFEYANEAAVPFVLRDMHR
eukprot:scaffold349819_cov18-Prasinocladus_malaysianus.AAC.1